MSKLISPEKADKLPLPKSVILNNANTNIIYEFEENSMCNTLHSVYILTGYLLEIMGDFNIKFHAEEIIKLIKNMQDLLFKERETRNITYIHVGSMNKYPAVYSSSSYLKKDMVAYTISSLSELDEQPILYLINYIKSFLYMTTNKLETIIDKIDIKTIGYLGILNYTIEMQFNMLNMQL